MIDNVISSSSADRARRMVPQKNVEREGAQALAKGKNSVNANAVLLGSAAAVGTSGGPSENVTFPQRNVNVNAIDHGDIAKALQYLGNSEYLIDEALIEIFKSALKQYKRRPCRNDGKR